MANNLKRNAEGYSDPTAYEGLKGIIAEETALKRKVNFLIKIIKYIVAESGFELLNRVEIRDTKTGRTFK